MVSRAFYRIGQLRRALNPRVTDSERAAARETLGDALYPLFESMAAADQRHCLDLFETLLRGGHTYAPMLKAALVHDCGKGTLAEALPRRPAPFDGPECPSLRSARHARARIGVVERVLYVLLTPVPPLLAAAAQVSGGIAALRVHGARTLELAREHGADDEVMALLEQMEGVRALDERGRALKKADDAT